MGKKILFVLHEGIGNTIFHSQVVEHYLDMKFYGYTVDILSYNTEIKLKKISEKNYEKIKEMYPECNIMLRNGINTYYPFSRLINFVLLLYFILKSKNNYEIIHARTNYTSFISLFLKLFGKFKIVWDCRGDSLSELKDALSRKSCLLRFCGAIFWIPLEKIQLYYLTKYSDSAIFVSKTLYELYEKEIKFECKQIIPCLVSENKFYFNNELRNSKRLELNIRVNEMVYIYSGSMVAYQSLGMQKKLLTKIYQNPLNQIFYITSDIDMAKAFFNDFHSSRFHIIKVPFDQMNNYLNLADFAILLRDNKLLNRVASPTKFGEYCMTGLKVVMNDVVEQANEYSKNIGNHINYLSSDFLNYNIEDRIIFARKAKEYYSRTIVGKRYLNIYE